MAAVWSTATKKALPDRFDLPRTAEASGRPPPFFSNQIPAFPHIPLPDGDSPNSINSFYFKTNKNTVLQILQPLAGFLSPKRNLRGRSSIPPTTRGFIRFVNAGTSNRATLPLLTCFWASCPGVRHPFMVFLFRSFLTFSYLGLLAFIYQKSSALVTPEDARVLDLFNIGKNAAILPVVLVEPCPILGFLTLIATLSHPDLGLFGHRLSWSRHPTRTLSTIHRRQPLILVSGVGQGGGHTTSAVVEEEEGKRRTSGGGIKQGAEVLILSGNKV